MNKSVFKFEFENSYRDNLSLQGVIEHLSDDICEKLNCNLKDIKIEECDRITNYCRGIFSMENGLELMTLIYYNKIAKVWYALCEEI
jgi:hypothetical protein